MESAPRTPKVTIAPRGGFSPEPKTAPNSLRTGGHLRGSCRIDRELSPFRGRIARGEHNVNRNLPYPFPSLSKTRKASRISSSESVSFILRAIMVRNSGKSMVPFPVGGRKKNQSLEWRARVDPNRIAFGDRLVEVSKERKTPLDRSSSSQTALKLGFHELRAAARC